MGAYQQDLRVIKEGGYKLPWDMTTLGHRQTNPLYMAGKASEYLREAVGVLTRRKEGKPAVKATKSPLYPDYYQNDFHFQTDGWMSAGSASVYEVSTETLFVGRQDASVLLHSTTAIA